jgi:catechol-2,3-dioxygenase
MQSRCMGAHGLLAHALRDRENSRRNKRGGRRQLPADSHAWGTLRRFAQGSGHPVAQRVLPHTATRVDTRKKLPERHKLSHKLS